MRIIHKMQMQLKRLITNMPRTIDFFDDDVEMI